MQTFTAQNALLTSAIAGAGAYAAYKYNLIPKKVAAYGALGIIALSIVATEAETLSNSLPTIFGGVLVIGVLVLIASKA